MNKMNKQQKLKRLIELIVRRQLRETNEKFRAEVTGIGENRWSTNNKEFNTEKEAQKWLDNLSSKWFGYDLGRVVPISTPENQQVDLKNDNIYQNFRKKENASLKEGHYGTFDWPYYYLRNGILYDEDGHKAYTKAPKFNSVEEAEKWLEDNNDRGDVVENSPSKKQIKYKNKISKW